MPAVQLCLPEGAAPKLDIHIVTTHNYGMQSSKHRTSFALDEDTIRGIQHLASQWQVSQAEVVRRAIRMTAERERSEANRIHRRLTEYQDAGRMTAEVADEYLSEVAADRSDWKRGSLS